MEICDFTGTGQVRKFTEQIRHMATFEEQDKRLVFLMFTGAAAWLSSRASGASQA